MGGQAGSTGIGVGTYIDTGIGTDIGVVIGSTGINANIFQRLVLFGSVETVF
jgi:hypothetical protein